MHLRHLRASCGAKTAPRWLAAGAVQCCKFACVRAGPVCIAWRCRWSVQLLVLEAGVRLLVAMHMHGCSACCKRGWMRMKLGRMMFLCIKAPAVHSPWRLERGVRQPGAYWSPSRTDWRGRRPARQGCERAASIKWG